MNHPLKIVLFSRIGAPSLRNDVAPVHGVKVVAEASDWPALQQALTAQDPDALLVALDPEEIASGFSIIQRIAEVAPGCKIIGICDDNRPDTIIRAMRAGCHQFVPAPIETEDLRAAIDRVRPVADAAESPAQRICVMPASGGAGATTIACNLALELAAHTQQRVALIDLNLEFSDIACHFDVAPKGGVVDICRGDREIDKTLLQSALHHLDSGVSLLSKSAYPTEVNQIDTSAIENMYRVLTESYPFVVTDLPRAFTPVTIGALGVADRVLLITQLAVPFLRNATRIYEHLLHLGAEEEHIEIVVNRSNASYEMISSAEVADHFGRPVFAEIPNDYKRVTNVRDLGASLMNEAPNSPARLGIYNLACRICNGGAEPAPPTGEAGRSGAGGLLSLFWSRKGKQKAGA